MTQLYKNIEQGVDNVIQSFWKNGYLTLSRKYGTYLPNPPMVGNYEVDAVGKQKNKFAIGLVLSNDDLNNPDIYKKIEFLASRQSKHTRKNVTLFIGIPEGSKNKVNLIIQNLSPELKKNIRLVPTSKSTAKYN